MARFTNLLIAATCIASAVTFSAPANAAAELTLIENSSACSLGYTGATACQGYYGGNLSGATVQFQQDALNQLLNSPTAGPAVGGTAPVIDWTALTNSGALLNQTNLNGNVLSFGTTLYGRNIIGMHFGNNADPTSPPNNVSAFYVFDFGTAGSRGITFTPGAQGFSNAVVYSTTGAVPEPATWAMMLLGFGGIGASLRSRRRSGFMPQAA
jgi:PEP-CTERM motif